MKANLGSRKSVRLQWFEQEKVPFSLKYSLGHSYYSTTVMTNELRPQIFQQYVFSGLETPIPSTNIILFEEGLPQSYLKTTGSIGKKFSTLETVSSDLTVIDRIIKVDQGDEKITKKPVSPHEANKYKELQIHERQDKISRKITIKNETIRPIKELEVTFIENKEIRFLKSNPPAHESDPPEYTWKLEIPAEESVIIELTIEYYFKHVYKIEKEEKKTRFPA
ncbi:MAG: hypothetical protein GF308_03420 [Candidatus Heimdallarchaeota archaeon]|nr:hypothetical protein [Candidatus Heimdallarchaeota archaeon]